MNTKNWHQSKTIWLGVLTTITSLTAILIPFIETGDFSPVAVITLIQGLAIVVIRKWFTNTTIE